MGKTRRELMLEEMGLTPIWRLRSDPAAAPEAGTDVETGAAEPVAASASLSRGSPVSEGGDRRAQIMSLEWPALKARVAQCADCVLHQKRNKTVFGVGDENADWLFVGEGPGAEEDAQGEPFVGQAGRLLDNMLAAIQLKRGQNVYIANCVKCRPPGNRNPEPGELHACEPYLHRQIELIRPKLIVALGRVAVSNLLATDASIASLRGKLHEYRGTALIVTYHPAYLLRNLPDKAKAWADLCFAVRAMNDLQSANGVSSENGERHG
ncbi:MAG TPA: uracil-DNA glycosylase [Burkholderiales bacterium]|jgi:DNA polymerase|nr:uracil-DNA glycosylase [Burkholderiales bacterium]